MLDGAVVTCVLVFLVSGLWAVARDVIRARRVNPYRRYLNALRRVTK